MLLLYVWFDMFWNLDWGSFLEKKHLTNPQNKILSKKMFSHNLLTTKVWKWYHSSVNGHLARIKHLSGLSVTTDSEICSYHKRLRNVDFFRIPIFGCHFITKNKIFKFWENFKFVITLYFGFVECPRIHSSPLNKVWF